MSRNAAQLEGAKATAVVAAPAGPWAPVGPAGPWAPVGPTAPCGPTGPGGPGGPVMPMGPARPGGPGGPGGPVMPAGPTQLTVRSPTENRAKVRLIRVSFEFVLPITTMCERGRKAHAGRLGEACFGSHTVRKLSGGSTASAAASGTFYKTLAREFKACEMKPIWRAWGLFL